MAFNLEVRLQRFADAERAVRRLLELAPQLGELAGNARAGARAVVRLTDSTLAGKRGRRPPDGGAPEARHPPWIDTSIDTLSSGRPSAAAQLVAELTQRGMLIGPHRELYDPGEIDLRDHLARRDLHVAGVAQREHRVRAGFK